MHECVGVGFLQDFGVGGGRETPKFSVDVEGVYGT